MRGDEEANHEGLQVQEAGKGEAGAGEDEQAGHLHEQVRDASLVPEARQADDGGLQVQEAGIGGEEADDEEEDGHLHQQVGDASLVPEAQEEERDAQEGHAQVQQGLA